MAANYEQRFLLNYNLESVYQLFSSAKFVMDMKFEVRLNSREPQNCCLRFNHGMSMSSWGECITVILTPVGNTQTSMSIRSECALPTQIIDWGKNKQIVNQINDYVRQNIGLFLHFQPVYVTPQSVPNQTQQQKYCVSCGCEIPANRGAFCSSCGAKLD